MDDGRRPELVRALGFGAIVAFGVGDILGAGIYALIGKIAGVAGHLAWVSFAVSMGVAGLTALSYAEWSGRVPRSGGEASFVRAATRTAWAPLLVGWMVLFSGMVSMATVARAAAGYAGGVLGGVPAEAVIVAFLLLLTVINLRGIQHSSAANLVCTAIEVAGLGLVVFAGLRHLAVAGPVAATGAPEAIPLGDVLRGGALSFFAFIGFEDMVNVAEEVKDARRTLPRAILIALVVAGAIYMLIAWMAVQVVPPAELAASKAPLLEIVRRGAPWVPAGLFTVVALFAVANTALLNYVMGSRLLYGMARLRLLPAALGELHPVRRVPRVAILSMLVLVLAMALLGELVALSGTTSTLLLLVFFAVNLSLLHVKRRAGPPSGFRVPAVVPALGAAASLGLIAFMPVRSQVAAAVIVAAGGALVLARAVVVRRARPVPTSGPGARVG